MANKSNGAQVEVTSQQLLNELSEIKDRVGALENVAGIANQEILIRYFSEVLNGPQRKEIMAACRTPQKKEELIKAFDFKSRQALDHHLKPLREGLIHETHIDGVTHFEWSLLFKRLPKRKIDDLIGKKDKPAKK